MCPPKAPRVPPPPVPRQAPRLPDQSMTADQMEGDARRRSAMSSFILTGPNGVLGAAPTAGKAVLGG